MGAFRAGGLTGLMNQPSAQVVDGSLKFDGSKSNKLTKTFGSSSNRTTWTWSGWVKKAANDKSDDQCLFGAYNANNDTDWFEFGFGGSNDHSPVDKFYWTTHSTTSGTTALLRDNSAWYHCLVTYNGIHISVYINNKLMLTSSKTGNLAINANFGHSIGMGPKSSSPRPFFGSMSQVYLIDGLQIGPGYFGFTDPLTGTWRPKKFRAEGTTVNDGTVWSSGIPGNVLSGYPATQGFDGNTSNFVYADNSSTMTWTAPKRITGQKIEVYVYAGNTHPILNVNGQSTGAVVGGTAQHNVWVDVTDLCGGPGGRLETISAFGQNIGGVDRSSGWSAVRVDGVILIDSTTQNLAFGTNGFYLPMDGNSPIGQDKSGNGNDFTPVNFGGSTGVDQATGALPILEGAGGAVANVATRNDAYAANLVLALPLVGSANDVSNQINSGSTTQTVTNNGGATASSSLSNFYGGSFTFDGSDDYLSLGSAASEWKFLHDGATAYTVECWLYFVSFPGLNATFMGTDWGASVNTGFTMAVQANNRLSVRMGNGSNTGDFMQVTESAATTIQTNKWTHVAATYDLTTLRLFIDGVLVGSSSSKNTADTGNPTHTVYIGGEPNTTYGSKWLNGSMQDVRIYNGVAKYTSDFVPASTNPDILPDTPSGVSGSSKLTKITDGAVSFDGPTDGAAVATGYLSVPSSNSSDFNFGTGDFTWEAFIYGSDWTGGSSNDDQFVIHHEPTAGGDGSGLFVNGGQSYYYSNKASSRNIITGPVLVDKRWYHIAASRASGTLRLFVDGISVGSASYTDTYADSVFVLGRNENNNKNQFRGFISNFRVIKGTALYTSNFTPPSAPLTNVTNTKLLCCQSNGSAGSAAVSPNLGGVNDGTVWSSYLSSAAGLQSSQGAPLAFDGSTTTKAATPSNTGGYYTGETNALEFIPPSSIAFSSSVKVRGRGTGQTTGKARIDTGSGYGDVINLSTDGLETLVSGSGNLVKLKVWTITYSGENELAAIEIDGTNLLDPVTVNGDAAATNFNPFNTDINTVRGQETGYATMNPLDNEGLTLTDGNLNVTNMGSARQVHADIFVDSGKWYAEFTCKAAMNDTLFGVANNNGTSFLGSDTNSWGVISINGNRIHDQNGSGGQSSYGSSFTAGDVISVALDRDNGKWYAAKNGVYFDGGNPLTGANPAHSGLTGDLTFAVGSNSANGDVSCNFGQKPFKFPPPDGFQPLNAANVRPETVITRPDQYFGVTTYAGNATTQHIDVGLRPDFVWIKERTDTGGVSHYLGDTVRGINKDLQSNTTQIEGTNNGYGYVSSVDDNGFTVTQGSSDSFYTNGNPETYVAWTWKAGGNKGVFNVDDVGYANASDVNMSIGGLNSSVYDQSQTWSNYLTTNETSTDSYCNSGGFFENNGSGHMATEGFNGTLNTTTATCNDGDGKRITFTPPSAYAYTSKVEVYLHGTQVNSVYINGTDTGVDTVANSWSTVATGSGSITSMWFESDNSGHAARFAAIRIDGKILVDYGIDLSGLTQYPTIAATGCSVGTKQGFSIIKYTGNSTANATLAHGLSEAPKFVIIKNLSNTYGWAVLHTDAGTTGTTLDGSPEYYMLYLDGNAGRDNWSQDTIWDPTSTTVKIDQSGGANWVNNSNSNYIMYAWHDVPGLQKFGSCKGSGTSAAPDFVELGFKPSIVWVKRTDNTGNWTVWDSTRNTFNPSQKQLFPNTNSQESDSSADAIDILSNGFAIRSSSSFTQTGSQTYIYCAWAEAPTFNLYGGQSNAR